MNRLRTLLVVIPLTVALTACGATNATNEPAPQTTVEPHAPETTATTEPPQTGSYETGEAVGETSRELWENAKDFGRGFWDEFTEEGE